MRIVYDHQIFSTQVYGGISRYFVELCKEIDNIDGHEAKVLSPIYVNQYLKSLPDKLKQGKHTKRLPMTGRIIRKYNRLVSDSWLKSNKPDIVHATYFYPSNTRTHRNRKNVLTVYDMIHEKYSDRVLAGDKTAHLKSEAVKDADHVICISDSTRADLIHFLGIDPEKTSTIHLGFKPFPCNGTKSESQTDSPYLLHVGLRGGYKNFEALLHAYAASPQLIHHCRLVCFGGGPFSKNELALMNQLKIQESKVTHVTGDDRLLARYYKNATAFIYPSLYEGFGIPPLEAMSQDCPVLCSTGGSIPEVVGHAAEYFNPENPDDIAHAIENVVFDEERSNTLRSAGNQQFKKYSWNRCAYETLKIYESLF